MVFGWNFGLQVTATFSLLHCHFFWLPFFSFCFLFLFFALPSTARLYKRFGKFSIFKKKKERIKNIYSPSYNLPSWINFPLLFEQIDIPKWVSFKTNLSNYSFRKILKSLQLFLVLETYMAGTHSDQVSWYWT